MNTGNAIKTFGAGGVEGDEKHIINFFWPYIAKNSTMIRHEQKLLINQRLLYTQQCYLTEHRVIMKQMSGE